MPLPTYLMSNFPSVRPSLNLQFDSQPTPEDMTSHLASVGATFSRASIGTYTDANGLIQEASAGQARPNYSSAGVHEGLLIEESRTNLHLNSGDLTGNNSVVNEVSLSLQTVTNPINGQTQVTRITDTAVSDAHYIQSSTITADGSSDYTFSILAKAGTLSTCRLLITGGGVGTVQMIVDLSDGSILSGSGTVEDVGNGWYILSVTGTSTASSALGTRIYTTDGTNVTYTGSSQYIDVAYRQLEVGSFPTSYIPTSGATATRSADVCYIDGTAFNDFYNDDSGTFFVECIRDSSVDTLGVIYQAGDGTVANRIENFIDANGDLNNRYRRNNATIDPLPTPVTSFDDSVQNKIAFRYDQTSGKVFLNGEEVSSRTSLSGGPTGINELGIGRSLPSALELNGFIKRLIYFPRALQATEIQKLTQ